MTVTPQPLPVSDLDDSSVYDLIPEKRLVAAIIERAILDTFSRNKTDRECAFRWFKSKRRSKKTFTFMWCLDHLDISYARDELLEKIFSMTKFKLIDRRSPGGAI